MAFYRNKGDGTFEDRTEAAGLGKQLGGLNLVQTDYNNDGYLDLFIMRGAWMPQPMRPRLFHNNRNGTFTDVTLEKGITGPQYGFSCWAFDYDNDGYLDIFATCYHRTLDAVVRVMQGHRPPPGMDVTRVYRNLGGKKF